MPMLSDGPFLPPHMPAAPHPSFALLNDEVIDLEILDLSEFEAEFTPRTRSLASVVRSASCSSVSSPSS